MGNLGIEELSERDAGYLILDDERMKDVRYMLHDAG